MSRSREELDCVLRQYVSDTLADIDTAEAFWERHPKWQLKREMELTMMMDIKARVDNILKSGFLKSLKTRTTKESRLAELEKELTAVVNDTLQGLDTLRSFLEAVDRLAVTRLPVLEEGVVRLMGVGISDILNVVAASLYFRPSPRAFFQPRIQNVEGLACQLEKYIQDTQKICRSIGDSVVNCQRAGVERVLDQDLSEDDVQVMLLQIRKLDEIRKNQNLRLGFLLQGEMRDNFLHQFEVREARMLEFLNELEGAAVQLDRMFMGAKISSVAGSSVGVVSGVLAILGLALTPVTAGLSLALTMSGIGLGITSGVSNVVTTVTEVGVNKKKTDRANEVFCSLREDMESTQSCLENVKTENDYANRGLVAGGVLYRTFAIGDRIYRIVDCASAVNVLKNEEQLMSMVKVLGMEGKPMSNVLKVGSELPDVSHAAIKGPLALSSSVRAGLIAANALFIGVDVIFICKDSISLAKGCKSERAKFIRARAALCRLQVEAWQEVRDSLRRGLQLSEHDRGLQE